MNSLALSSSLLVAIGLIIALLLLAASRKGKQRAADLRAVADALGFNYAGNDSSLTFQANTALFRRGSRRRFRNVMNGTYGSYPASVFDYSYTVSGGESSSTFTQTVVAFRQDHQLPWFELRPEGFLDRIADAFVHRDIDFETHPEFSKRYALRGDDGTAIRVVFTPALLSFFEMLPPERKWHIEGSGFTLLAYRANLTVAPQEIRTFVEETCSIANSFFAASGRSPQSRNA